MSDRFDYEAIGELYQKMNDITGSEDDPESIAGIFKKENDAIDKRLCTDDEDETALKGPLANQLNLDWDNVSSGFPSFVSNFKNWSQVVAQASGNLKEFELEAKQRVEQQKSNNPLGYASGGITSNYVAESQAYYDDNIDQFNADMEAVQGRTLYELTGADYAVSGASTRLERLKVQNAVELGLSFAGLIATAAGAQWIIAGAPGLAGTELAVVDGAAGTGSWTVTAGGSSMIGDGVSITIEDAVANATAAGNTSLATFAQTAASEGATTVVANAAGDTVQFLDGAGNVLYTASTVAP